MSTVSRSAGHEVTYSSDDARPSRSVAAGAEAFRADAVRVVAEGDEDVRHRLHETRRAADEAGRAELRRPGRRVERGHVDAPRKAGTPFGELAGVDVRDVQARQRRA